MASPIYEKRAREAVRLLIDDGNSRRQAAEKVGISVATLNNYIKKNTKPRKDESFPLHCFDGELKNLGRIDAAKKLRELRFSYCKISDIIGVSHTTVYNWRDQGVFNKIEETYARQR